MKSSIAEPSLRNSGTEQTSTRWLAALRHDFAHLIVGADRHGALDRDDMVAGDRLGDLFGGACITPLRSAAPLLLIGVPTAMNETIA